MDKEKKRTVIQEYINTKRKEKKESIGRLESHSQ